MQLTLKENFGVEGHAGYSDSVGIYLDIIQNRVLQIFALLGMEGLVSTAAEDIQDVNVKVLKCISPLSAEYFVTG